MSCLRRIPLFLFALYVWVAISSRATAASVDHFSWNAVPSSAAVGQSFAVALQARDAGNNVVSSYNGSVSLNALVPGPAPTILITELESQSVKRLEFSNVSTNPMNIGGWRIFLYDGGSWPAPKVSFTIPAGTVCPALSTFQIRSGGAFPGAFPLFNTGIALSWGNFSVNTQTAALLVDANGQPVDFFCAAEAFAAQITVPMAIDTNLWLGAPMPTNTTFATTYSRRGQTDGNTPGDWATISNTIGVLNPSMTFPVTGNTTSSPLAPGLVTFTNGVWAGMVAANMTGTNLILNADDGAGLNGKSAPLNILALPPLALQVPHQAFKASPGLVGQGSVKIPQALTSNVVVSLSSSFSNLVVVPTSVTVLAGATNASFGITNLDDGLVEGPLPAIISAAAAGFTAATDAVTNYDKPPVSLSITLPSSSAETASWVNTGVITASTPVARDVRIWLSSANTNRLQVPDFVILPAGQSSVSFGFACVDDVLINGTEMITLTASVPGWISGQRAARVTDNENAGLGLTFTIFQVNEGSGVYTNAGTVQITGLLQTNLVVALTNNGPARVTMPATVIIPAGQTSASFNVTLPDDSLANGNQLVTVTASADGLFPAAKNLFVVDDDVYNFGFPSTPTVVAGGQSFPITVYAQNFSGSAIPGYSSSVNLKATNASGTIAVSPMVIGPFVDGIWSGNVTVAGGFSNVVLTAFDGSGHSGTSEAFDATAGASLGLATSDIAYDVTRGLLWVALQSGTNAQSVVSIDPASGAASAPIALGNVPGKLALSDDGQFLYVGLMTTGGVARVNLSSRMVDLRFPLQPGGGLSATEMAVPPGDAHALVVQRSNSGGTALFRDGVLKTNIVGVAFTAEYHFCFYDSPTNFFTLYPGGLRWNNIVSNGIATPREVFDSQYTGSYVYSGGLFFGSSGGLFDPKDFHRLGAYPDSGVVAADANAGQVYFVSGITARAYDVGTFAKTGQINLPIANNSAYKILRCGSNILAVATTATNLLLVQTPLIRVPPAADLSVTQTTDVGTIIAGSNVTYSITVSNAGPATAINVALLDIVSADAVFVSASTPQGTWSYTNSLVNYGLGSLAPGATVTVQLTVQAPSPGALVNFARLTGDGINFVNASSRRSNPVIFGAVLPGVTRLPYNSTGLVYDAPRNQLWISTERFGGVVDNDLHSISLSNGLPATTIPFGFTSSILALSANQNYLYAAYHNSGDFIRRVNLSSSLTDEDFVVNDPIVDIIGVAGYPSAAMVGRSGGDADIALYDNGVVVKDSAWNTNPGRLVQNPNIPSRIYRLYLTAPGGNLAKYDISTNTINVLDAANLFPSPGYPWTGDIRFGNGLLFSDFGQVVNPEALTNVASLAVSGLVETDPVAGVVYYLAVNGLQWSLMAFDISTFAPVWTSPVPGVSGNPSRLIKCGANVLAFRTDSDQLFILNINQMPHILGADLQLTTTVSATSSLTNVSESFNNTLLNAGPAPATKVFLTNQFPPDVVLQTITPSKGTYSVVSNAVIVNFGDIPAGSSVSLQVVATMFHPGTATDLASVAQSTPDPVASNNVALAATVFTTVPVADLHLARLAPVPPATPGGNWSYTLVVSNAGPDTASNVVFNEQMYSGGTLISATTTLGSLTFNTSVVTATLGTMTNGATASITLQFAATGGGLADIDTGVGSSTYDPNPYDNQLLAAVAVTGQVLAEEIQMPAADIAYDASHQVLLASVADTSATYSRSIRRYNLQTRTVDTVAPVGNQIGHVAVSDDGHYLYVAVNDTGGVARVDVPAGVVDLRFALNTPGAEFGPYHVEDLVVMPGSPGTVAAARGGYGEYNTAIGIFDSGVQRSNVFVSQTTGGSYFRTQFADAGKLYITSPYGFQTLDVTPAGVGNPGTLFGAYTGDFAVENGVGFSGTGLQFNAGNGALIGNFAASGAMAPNTGDGRVYFLTGPMVLRGFSMTNQTELWTFYFNPSLGFSAHLISLGTNGLAFTTGSRSFWIHSSVLAAPMTDLALQQTLLPSPGVAGGPVTASLTVVDQGPFTASGVTITNPIPANASFVSAVLSQGTYVVTNGAVICSLGSIPNLSSATATLTFNALAPGGLTNVASVASNEIDPIPINNIASNAITVVAPSTLSIRDASVIQSTNTKASISFTFVVTPPSSIPVSVFTQTADGTALAGVDYDSTAGAVVISAGAATRTVNLPIIRTNVSSQSTLNFYMNLSSPTNATLIRTQAVATIIKRAFETVSITGTSVVAGASSPTNALFKLSLNQTSSVPVVVQYQTVDNSAVGGVDYQPKTGTLTFPPGASNVILAVPIFAASAWQPTKTFSVVLFQPQQAILGVREAVGTILNTNPVPPLAILSRPASQSANLGTTVMFAVTATGNPLPLTYQWQFNGTNLGGATSSTLTLTNLQSSQAGNYNVVVHNAGSAVTNASAGLILPSMLNYTRAGQALVLTWSGAGNLLFANDVAGPYYEIAGATSPYTNWIGSEPGHYFRLGTSMNGLLSVSPSTNGQFTVSHLGAPGYMYVLQSSSNLLAWTTLQTNVAPFKFVESNAPPSLMRFYRAILWRP